MFAYSKKLTQLSFLFKYSNKFGTAKTSLYTWGEYASGTGFARSSLQEDINVPKRLEALAGQIAKVSMGPYHSAVITTSGELYTMGSEDFGALGISQLQQSTSYTTPKLVEYFKKNNQKVSQVACGDQFTLALTDSGDLYSWGFGGDYCNKLSCVLQTVFPRFGALGSGSTKNRFLPETVGGFRGQQIKSFSAGSRFSTVVTQSGDVYNWGEGADGKLGDGICEPVLEPSVNHNFSLLKDKEKLTIQKVRSANSFSVALFSDGNLYSWGKNCGGAMGIRQNLGINTDEFAYIPTPVVNEYFKGQKIVDFDVGFNTLVILTDKNKVYWSGLDLAYKPIQWDIPSSFKIKQVSASKDCFAAVTTDGNLLMFNQYLEPSRWRVGKSYFQPEPEVFGKGKVVEVGGNYGIRYALVQE